MLFFATGPDELVHYDVRSIKTQNDKDGEKFSKNMLEEERKKYY